MFDASSNVTLSEVGLSDLLEESQLGSYGDPDDVRRIAPEVLAGGDFSPESDIYSLGCLIFGEIAFVLRSSVLTS